MGFFVRDMMDEPFEEAAFKAPLNKVTCPVKTQFGFHLIVVTEKKD